MMTVLNFEIDKISKNEAKSCIPCLLLKQYKINESLQLIWISEAISLKLFRFLIDAVHIINNNRI